MRSLVPILLCLVALLAFSNATIYGWGQNNQGQLGLGHKNAIFTPAPITFFDNVLLFDVLTATNYAIFVCTNGTVYGSGLQFYGQFALGNTAQTQFYTPTVCPALNRSLDIVLSGTSCNANYNTNLLGWGNVAGYVAGKTVGSFPRIQAASPALRFDGKVLSVHTVQEGIFVRLANNTVWAAGNNAAGRLGTGGPTTTTYTFVRVPFWQTVTLQTIFSSQSRHTCALSTSRSLYCWGLNDYGQLGVGDANVHETPTIVDYFDTHNLEVYKVVYGDAHTVVLTCGGRVFTFGSNSFGQLGMIADSRAHPVPEEIKHPSWNNGIADIVGGIYQTYARTNDGRWFVWGGGKTGALGMNSSDDYHLPVENKYLKSLSVNRIRSSSQSFNFYGWYDESVTNEKLSCPALVNECATGNTLCDENTQCTDFERGYNCTCNNGYEGDGFTCTNMNSCSVLLDICDGNATCSDLPTGPACTCNDGFEGEGSVGNCFDINECLGDPCAMNAACVNTAPLYTCQCISGFYGDPYIDGCSKSCQPGQYTLGNQCVNCPPGTYSDMNNGQSTHCIPCPYGTFSDQEGLSSVQGCQKCDVGGYSDLGSTYCSLCIHGYTNDPALLHSDNSTCVTCPLGTYGYYGKCIKCGEGTYSQEVTAKECRNCLPGYYQNLEATLDCQPCEPGYSSRGGTQSCTICPAGFYSPQASKDCLKCPPGTSTNGNIGQENCSLCPVGTYTGKASSQNCFDCPVGHFTNTTGSNACQRCPRGTFAENPKSTSCVKCPKGFVSPGTAATRCIECDFGSVTKDGITCVPCDAGTYFDAQTRSCVPCAPGTFSSVAQSTNCFSCSAGTFTEKSGSTYCKRCPVNSYSNSDTGFTSCTPCPPGTKNNGGSTNCY